MTIDHLGYADQAVRRTKLERNLRLLGLGDADRPDDPYTLFNLGWTTLELGRPVEALGYLTRSTERVRPTASFVRKLHALTARGHRAAGDPAAAQAACRAGLDRFPDDLELLAEAAVLLWEADDLAGAEGMLNRLMTAKRPDFAPAALGLADLLVKEKKWSELLVVADGLAREDPLRGRAQLLRAQAHLGRCEWAAAREALEAEVARDPRPARPWLLLSRALLQVGQDWAAAERALLAVLDRRPDHAEAGNNLRILRDRQVSPRGDRFATLRTRSCRLGPRPTHDRGSAEVRPVGRSVEQVVLRRSRFPELLDRV